MWLCNFTYYYLTSGLKTTIGFIAENADDNFVYTLSKNSNHKNRRRKIASKDFICQRAGAHEKFHDKDWKLGSIDYCLKKIRKTGSLSLADSEAVADRVRRELTRTLKQCQWLTLYWVWRTRPNASLDALNFTWNLHSPFQCSQEYSLWSSTQVPQATSCATTASEDNRVASLTRCKQLLKSYDDSAVGFVWFTDEKCLPLNHHSQRSGLRAGRNQEAIHSTQPSVTHAVDVQLVCYDVGCRVKNAHLHRQ